MAHDSDDEDEDEDEEKEAGEEEVMETRKDRNTLIEKYYVSCSENCW